MKKGNGESGEGKSPKKVGFSESVTPVIYNGYFDEKYGSTPLKYTRNPTIADDKDFGKQGSIPLADKDTAGRHSKLINPTHVLADDGAYKESYPTVIKEIAAH